MSIPNEFVDLLTTDCYATFATISPKGWIHQTVTWIDYDGEHLLINVSETSQKAKNIRANPEVSVNVLDPDHHHRYLSVSGIVDNITRDGAEKHADRLGWRYGEIPEHLTFKEVFGNANRLLLEICPEQVITLNKDVETID